MKKSLQLSTLLLLVAVVSQAQVALTGEVRPRTEMYGGNNSRLINEGESVGIATQQRTRLNFIYQDEDGFKVVISPQIVHFWGQMPQAYDLLGYGTQGDQDGAFTLFEAYAQYKASDWYTLKAGRQAISYGDQRWFGALGWAATGRAHDAFVNKLTFGKATIDVGLALNQTKHVQGVDSTAIANIRGGYKSLQYLWATIPVGDLKIQAMATNVTGQETLSAADVTYANTTTFGLLPTFTSGDIVINGSAYFQSSDVLSSSLFAADITYKGLGTPITLGADFVSGDDPTTEDVETWQQPFGTNHKFYGFMDFFYVGETASFGLNDIYVKTVAKTGEKTSLTGFVHFLSTNQDFADGEGNMVGGNLGTEVDLVFNFNVSKPFNLKLGYSTIFADELFEEYKAGDSGAFNQWAWLQLTFKPKFL